MNEDQRTRWLEGELSDARYQLWLAQDQNARLAAERDVLRKALEESEDRRRLMKRRLSFACPVCAASMTVEREGEQP